MANGFIPDTTPPGAAPMPLQQPIPVPTKPAAAPRLPSLKKPGMMPRKGAVKTAGRTKRPGKAKAIGGK